MAALIDATTGYNVITDYGDDLLENPFSVSQPAAATGPQPYDDFTDSGPEDFLDSGSSLENPFSVSQPQGIAWDVGATRNVYIKTFAQDEDAPRLGFSTSFAYLFALILTWIVNLFGSLSFNGETQRTFPRQFTANLSILGSLLTANVFARIFLATLSSSGTLLKSIRKSLSSSLSFIGDLTASTIHIFEVTLEGTLSFVGSLSRSIHALTALIFSSVFARVKTILQNVTGYATSIQHVSACREETLTVDTTPTELSLIGTPENIVFVHNQSQQNIEIDSSSSFDQFPQRIPPDRAVYLTPETGAGSIFLRSTEASTAHVIGTMMIPIPPGADTIYFSFDIKIHSAPSILTPINIGFSDAGIFVIGGVLRFWVQSGAVFEDAGSISFDTWHTIDMKMFFDGGGFTLTPRLDGTPFSDLSFTTTSISQFTIGGCFSPPVEYRFDNVKVGTTGYGTSDIFSADFTSSIVPPFNENGGLTLDSGTALCIDDDSRAEADFNFPPTGTDFTIYIRFDANMHDGSDNADLIHFGESNNDSYIAVYANGSQWQFYISGSSSFVSEDVDTVTLDTTTTIDMKIVADIYGRVTMTPKVNGTQYADLTAAINSPNAIKFGAIFSGGTNNHNLDNLTIGTTTWGSSDIFSADFSSTIVPPFDSVTGTGISISGGTLLISNGGSDAWAEKSISL